LLLEALLLNDGTLLVVTTRGVYLYPDGDLNATPRHIDYDPNPVAADYSSFMNAPVLVSGNVVMVGLRQGVVAVDLTTGTTSLMDTMPVVDQGPAWVSPVDLPEDAELQFVTDTRVMTLEPANDAPRLRDIVLRNARNGREVARIPEVTCDRYGEDDLLLSADETMLYHVRTGAMGGVIRAWSLNGNRPTPAGEVVGFRNFATGMDFSADGASLYVAYSSGFPACGGPLTGDSVIRYDMTTGTAAEVLTFPSVLTPVSVATNANEDLIVGGFGRMALRLDGVVSGVEGQSGLVASVALADDGTAYAYMDRSIVQFGVGEDVARTLATDVSSGSLIVPGRGQAMVVTDDVLAYVSPTDTVTVVDRTTDTEIVTLTFDRPVNGVLYDDESRLLGVHYGNGSFEGVLNKVTFYRLGDTVEEVATAEVNPGMQAQGLTPGGAVLAVTNIGGDLAYDSIDIGESLIHFYDTATGERIGGFLEERIQYPLAISPDGTLLVVMGGGGDLLVYAIR
jgi:hypothetical protein